MQQEPFWKSKGVFCAVPILLLMLTGAQAQAQPAAARPLSGSPR